MLYNYNLPTTFVLKSLSFFSQMKSAGGDWARTIEGFEKRLRATDEFIKNGWIQCEQEVAAAKEVAASKEGDNPEVQNLATQLDRVENMVTFLENMIDSQVYGEIAADLDPLTAHLQEEIIQQVSKLWQHNSAVQSARGVDLMRLQKTSKDLQKQRVKYLTSHVAIVQRKRPVGRAVDEPEDRPVATKTVSNEYLDKARKIFEAALRKSVGEGDEKR